MARGLEAGYGYPGLSLEHPHHKLSDEQPNCDPSQVMAFSLEMSQAWQQEIEKKTSTQGSDREARRDPGYRLSDHGMEQDRQKRAQRERQRINRNRENRGKPRFSLVDKEGRNRQRFVCLVREKSEKNRSIDSGGEISGKNQKHPAYPAMRDH